MLHAKARLGTAFLLTSLLTALSGMASAEDGAGTPIKLIDGYTGRSAILLPGQSITMSGTYYTYTTQGEVTSSTASFTSSGVTVTGGYSAPSSVDSPQTIAGLPITSAATRHFGQGERYVPVSKTTPNSDPSGCSGKAGEPIVMSTGAKVETYTDFVLPGEMGLQYQRFYTSNYFNHLTAQAAWSDTFSYALDDTCLTNPTNGTACKQVMITRPNGSDLVFINTASVSAPIYVEQSGGVATLVLNANGTYTLQDEDGTTQVYTSDAPDANGVVHALGAIQSIMDASGVGWTFSYAADGSQVITHTNGQSITKRFPSSNTMTVTDPAGHVFTYTLTGVNNNFASVTYPGAPATTIAYQYAGTSNNNKLTEVDYNGVPYAYTTYASNGAYGSYGSANGTYYADGSQATSLTYGTTNNTPTVTVTNALGHTQVNTYGATVASNGDAVLALTSTSDNAVADCGATEHTRAYDSNGNLSQTVDNNGNVHTYSYATNGQLQTETEASGTSQARTTNYVWDSTQQLNRLLSVTVEGWSKTAYAYNAQNRLASVAVTNLSGNGTANQTLTTTYNYTLYANGMVHTMSVTHPSPSGSDTEVYTYDALGNLASLANGLGQTTSYSNYNGLGEPGHVVGPNGDVTDYVYDARGRKQTKTTYPNGTAANWQYTYDGFGLLYTLTTPDNEITTWNRDAEMRVQTITHNDKDGTSTETFGYDPNGDVTSHVVTRGGVTSLSESVLYDALGRVYQKQGQHGQTLTYGYDGNGNVLTITDAAGHSTVNTYDHLDRLTQTVESGGASPAMPTTAPAINVPSDSTSGAYTVSWSSITGATYYVLQERVGGGGWSTVQSTSAISWSPTGKTTNTYGYQVKACNATGCSPWSTTGTINVVIPTAPTNAPNLTVPGNSANGNYAVSWTSVANTSTYNLQEQVNGGSWSAIQNSTSLSWSVNGKTSATYGYRVQACNAIGCGPWSNTGTMVVAWPPIPGTPAISVPRYNYNGGYTVTWNAVSNAANYPLYQSINGGGWTLIQNNTSTSRTVSGEGDGTYSYLVSACDISGCSTQTGGTVTVTIPTPIAINGQTYWGTNILSSGSGNEGIGFDIAGGNTWEVFHTKPGNAHIVLASGGLPYGAVTVQYTWTDAGVPSGYTDALGSITSNGASSPVSVSGNPSTMYLTGTFNINGDHAHQYHLRVDFFNAAGVNVSSSTGTLVGEVTGNQ